MQALIDRTLAAVGTSPLDLAPRRFGRVVACDGGLIEVSGLGVPIGTLCSIAQGASTEHRAETIGFRNGHTMMMMLGDTVLLRPGAIVRPEGNPGMLSVGEQYLGRAVDGAGEPIDGRGPVM
ncbi:MAG TPA: flagellum-specific ATP synthase FliI, partial [Erythrobacter sp.]|nr:flagellum-specific ATP synthase FliI [Erythrobacter sp.]